MRAGDLLRQLDQRLLPPLAQGMTRLGQGPIRLRVLTGVALASTVAVLVTAVWAADRRPVGDLTVGDVTRVGVVDGQSIPGYVETSRDKLAALLARPTAVPETYALVSLSAYLAPDRLSTALRGVAVAEVYSRLPLPDAQTQIVRIPALRIPADVIAGMTEIAERKDREARDYQARSAALAGQGDQVRDLRKLYDTGAEIASAEATAYRLGCSCVYAAVVRAAPVALSKMASRPEVRAVDPAPEVTRLDRTVFTPPLPEQLDVVRPPIDSAVPSAADGTAAGSAGAPNSPSDPAPPAEILPGSAADTPPVPAPPSPSPSVHTTEPTAEPTPTGSSTPVEPSPSASTETSAPPADPTSQGIEISPSASASPDGP